MQRTQPLRIFLVNVTKSAVSCGFGHITEEIFDDEKIMFCAVKPVLRAALISHTLLPLNKHSPSSTLSHSARR